MDNLNTTIQVGITAWTVPVTALTAPKALIPMVSSGAFGETGYTQYLRQKLAK